MSGSDGCISQRLPLSASKLQCLSLQNILPIFSIAGNEPGSGIFFFLEAESTSLEEERMLIFIFNDCVHLVCPV